MVNALGDAEAARVADAVGDLPLALEQAGSLLADTGLDTDTYVRLLDERAERLLGQPSDGPSSMSVTASWAVGFDRLASGDLAALQLLTVLAWCSPEPM